MTTSPVMGITEEILGELEQKAKAAIEDGIEEGFDYDPSIGMTLYETRFACAANPATILALIAHIRSLEARMEIAEKHAKRYLWLRDRGNETFLAFSARAGYSGKKCDAAIDAAIAQEGQSHE